LGIIRLNGPIEPAIMMTAVLLKYFWRHHFSSTEINQHEGAVLILEEGEPSFS
jgi:hypothetical protein